MSNSRSKKILQLLAPDSSITPEASSNSIVNAPDNSELLNELDTYSFDLDIESIDQFIILGDSVNNNININCSNNNFDNNFNNCDTVEPVSFESNVENYCSNNTTTILSNDEYCVVTPDIEKSLEVDVVMPVSIINDNNTDSNLGNDDNVNNIITNPITNENKWKFLGKKKRKKDDRVVNKLNRSKGQCYKKMKKNNTIELVPQKEMKPNPCLDKKMFK
ncbi:hypothetical protein ACI65C_013711 [Semiaphis heraclei]